MRNVAPAVAWSPRLRRSYIPTVPSRWRIFVHGGVTTPVALWVSALPGGVRSKLTAGNRFTIAPIAITLLA
jgi:hypothetical protein